MKNIIEEEKCQRCRLNDNLSQILAQLKKATFIINFLSLREKVDQLIAIFQNCNILIITRPKPAYGRQGLAGSWGQDTNEVSTFLVFLTSHFAPAALSSDLTNLGPLLTMKIHLETLQNHGNQPKTIKTIKPPGKPWKPIKNHEKP